MKNKELIDRLQAYFLTQDPNVVARILANYMIDMHRLCCVWEIPEEEQENLACRMSINSEKLQDFAKNGHVAI